MRIAGIQIGAGPDIERNVQRAVDMAEVAAEKDAGIICYPELFLTPWFPKREDKTLRSLAADAGSETLARFQVLSETTKTVLIVPFFESANDKNYNSAAVFDSGKLVGVYRKI